jgi:RNA polymerase sigma-70 factor, ECF subfamily
VFDLSRFRSGDHRYFDTLVQKHGPMVMSVAYSYGKDIDRAEDLVQEIWMHIFEKRSQYEGRGAFGAWVNRVAHSVCVGCYRARRARDEVRERYAAEGHNEQVGWRPVDALAQTERGEFRARLLAALATLPRRQQEAFVLTRIEGHSAEKAAELIGATGATVRSNARHAVKRLRLLMMEDSDDDMSRPRSAP